MEEIAVSFSEATRQLTIGHMMRRGDYGYDAPYFPAIFGFLSVATGIGAPILWFQGEHRPAMQMALGALQVERRRLGWRFWWGNPIAVTMLLTASKALTVQG